MISFPGSEVLLPNQGFLTRIHEKEKSETKRWFFRIGSADDKNHKEKKALKTKQEINKDPFTEAKRYLANARDILKNKGGNGVPGYYNDVKYVKMACHTAWCGVLVALEEKVPSQQEDKRKTVDIYKKYLSTRNRKILNDFVAAYQHLHLWGGYDGVLYKKTVMDGFELAEGIIDWCKKN